MWFPETRAALKKLVWNYRSLLCEQAIGFAYWICPEGYTPSPSELLAEEMRKNRGVISVGKVNEPNWPYLRGDKQYSDEALMADVYNPPGPVVGVIDGSSAAAGQVGQVLRCTTPGTTSSVTFTSAAPGICSWANHNISIAGAVNFTAAVIPTGLVAGTTYYVSSQSYSANSFAVSSSVANAIAGTSITTSSTGTTVVGQAWAILANNTAKDFGGIALPPGDWYVQTSRISVPANTTVVAAMRVSTSLVSATSDTTPGRFNNIVFGTAPASGYISNGGQAITLDTTESEFNTSAASTNVFGLAADTFTTAAQTTYGTIRATRRSR